LFIPERYFIIVLLKYFNSFRFMQPLKIRGILFLSVFILFFSACKSVGKISRQDVAVIAVDTINIVKDDSVSLLIIAPYKKNIETEMNQVLGYTLQSMDKGKPEALLNNFVADLVLKKSNEYYVPSDSHKIDMCILNNGGLRSTLPKGKIIKSNIFELMPFDNKLVVITLSGEMTKQMFEYIVAKGGEPIAGFKIGIKDTAITKVHINGILFDKSKTYKIVTSDYLAYGGDKMYFFKNAIKIEPLDRLIRDIIIEYCIEENNKGNKLNSQLDKRIYYE